MGWINPAGVTIDPTNVNSQVLADLPPDGGSNPNQAGAKRIAALAFNDDHSDYDPTNNASIYTTADRDYILGWMFKFAGNPDPINALTSLATPDATDPTGINTTSDFTAYAGYMDYDKYGAYTADGQNYKLVNHFQVKYCVQFKSGSPPCFDNPIVLQSGAIVGATVNPTGVPPDFIENTINLLSHLPPPFNVLFTIASWTAAGLLQPQYGPANGIIGTDPENTLISKINDGSPDIFAIRAFNTLEGLDVPNPVFWENIGSKITFRCGDTGPTPVRQNYPTYYRYDNGIFNRRYDQARRPQDHFNTAPYPFGTVPTWGLPPTPPDSIPLIDSLPMLPTINGGRNGIATLPADVSAGIPAYTLP